MFMVDGILFMFGGIMGIIFIINIFPFVSSHQICTLIEGNIYANDLWAFNLATSQWSYISGSLNNSFSPPSFPSTSASTTAVNYPAGRYFLLL
jgi:hypothetical protein